MRGGQDEARAPVLQFTNCRILRGRALLRWGPGPGSCSGAGPGAAWVRPRAGGVGTGSCSEMGCGTGSCSGAGLAAAKVKPRAVGLRDRALLG